MEKRNIRLLAPEAFEQCRLRTAMIEYLPANRLVDAPVCSVCIANFNGALLLERCLGSVFSQIGDVPFEVIVHDDASTDDSVRLLRERYPQVTVLAGRENVGYCVSNNRMVQRARGEFILLLNNDAELYPDALRALADAATNQGEQILTLPQYDLGTGELVDRGDLLDVFFNPVPNLDRAIGEVAFALGACFWIPRRLWNELGGFPEWMGSVAEDVYLCSVARLRGYPVRVLDRSGYLHRQGASFGGNRAAGGALNTTYRRRLLSERNKTATMVICTPTLVVWPLLVLHVCLLALEGATLSLLRADWNIWQRIYGPVLAFVFSDMPALCARRALVQRSRRISWRLWFGRFVFLPRKITLLRRYGVPNVR